MREVRKNSMRKQKKQIHHQTKLNHHYDKGHNMDSRQIQAVMNEVDDIDPEAKAPFNGFINAISLVVGFWVIIGSILWVTN